MSIIEAEACNYSNLILIIVINHTWEEHSTTADSISEFPRVISQIAVEDNNENAGYHATINGGSTI